MICKVCQSAGKSREVFTSHYVRDSPGPNGKVVCPTLLNQKCRNCNKKGHTVSYCPEKNKKKYETPQTAQSHELQVKQSVWKSMKNTTENMKERPDSPIPSVNSLGTSSCSSSKPCSPCNHLEEIKEEAVYVPSPIISWADEPI